MKSTLLCCYLFLFCGSVVAQTPTPIPEEEKMVSITPDELKSLVRKMAQLRYQRTLHLRARQIAYQRQLAQRTRSLTEGKTDTVYAIRTPLLPDTVSPPQELSFRSQTPSPQTAAPANNYGAELTALRNRLDRQEEILLQIRDNVPPVPAPTETRRDTLVQQIIQRSETSGEPLSREDLRELSREVADLNEEIGRLRNRVTYEAGRRERAEERMETLQRRADNPAQALAPPVITQPSPPQTIRDTVVVYRDRIEPVLVPTTPKTDTVVVYRETVRQVTDTVVQERTVREEVPVVKTDTVQLAAKEPLSFPTIFFANNSSTLSAAHRDLLSSAAGEVMDRKEFVFRLTGYASPSGNAEYNRQLSEKRAGAVRDGLIARGITADRITVVPGGIDYQPASAAAARRVEVRAVPR